MFDPEALRRSLDKIGSRESYARFAWNRSYVSIAVVTPKRGFASFRVPDHWIREHTEKAPNEWNLGRLVLRIYDITYIEFNGFNAHRIIDIPIPSAGHCFFNLPHAGTVQLAEVGMLLASGEFVPAARSGAVHFPPDGASEKSDLTALYVYQNTPPEPVASPWDADSYLRNRLQIRLCRTLRIGVLSFESKMIETRTAVASFVDELTRQLANMGADIHIFLPASPSLTTTTRLDGAWYHPLPIQTGQGAINAARAYARHLDALLPTLPAMHVFHMQEWMTSLAASLQDHPKVLAITSTEPLRRRDAPPNDESLAIEEAERAALQNAPCVILPKELWTRAASDYPAVQERMRVFPMHGSGPDAPGAATHSESARSKIGVSAGDRLVVFIGPLEHASGPDLVVESMGIVIRRHPGVRVAFVGYGGLAAWLPERARQLGVEHAVRWLGHLEGPVLRQLVHACDAIIMPSRYRMPHDEGVVHIARLAAKPVVITHGGPSHLVIHGETGIIAYDNPNSIVWAIEQVASHSERFVEMGFRGRIPDNTEPTWQNIALRYVELLNECFPKLTHNDTSENAPLRRVG